MNVSFVIPNYNGKHLLQKHLPAVFASARGGDEVIVVDDASTDGSVKFIKTAFPQVRVIVQQKNMRFAEACNAGVRAAKHPLVFLLNTDVSPEKDALEYLVPHFEDKNVFAVGCLELDDTGKQSGRSSGSFQRGFLVHKRAENQNASRTLWAAGGSMMVKKELWEILGGMDRLFRPAYYEDIDLSYRAQKLGYTVSFEPRAKVHHHHESTNPSALGKNRMQIYAFKNSFLFIWKNVTDTQLLMQHLLWLPYHLVITEWRSSGFFILGFFMAIFQLPEVLYKRWLLQKRWKRTDKEVINRVNAI
ncbi:MAG: hypothetical protein A2840_02485 [Candidatus Buchananbacteria bacterium RIFCSPHIGHO2_01_FULL_47_11b]|uniref:Glycosyltransferase 2-like domain-containing protein n=1 Tax=Candidatus Buchananbacteria bacterium RIFCSPHIGHO2_01_FULL_47_11b TaxID=1797537 RepID=A0A1G1Y1G8_9BACT|nr:MAG: hypothetical protein A2840_02485 [Candidatus Buchananbacteria bacterium RIFCSPHIGHO2_01_FULL_47_11b]